ncbi:MAG: hypothetical protein FWG83_07065 [Oscillospiraceae bacterium]|nr:hypothetical protein [Oscillospiraceae bacterium]
MNELFLFLFLFFGIFGAVKTLSLLYTFMVRKINNVVHRRDEDDVKIWLKSG